jgi:hypothetical protein
MQIFRKLIFETRQIACKYFLKIKKLIKTENSLLGYFKMFTGKHRMYKTSENIYISKFNKFRNTAKEKIQLAHF